MATDQVHETDVQVERIPPPEGAEKSLETDMVVRNRARAAMLRLQRASSENRPGCRGSAREAEPLLCGLRLHEILVRWKGLDWRGLGLLALIKMSPAEGNPGVRISPLEETVDWGVVVIVAMMVDHERLSAAVQGGRVEQA
jgi:hypothetical protein